MELILASICVSFCALALQVSEFVAVGQGPTRRVVVRFPRTGWSGGG
jgi:hypothetical protein